MSNAFNHLPDPLKLLSNRVRRSYSGGMLIEQWQNIPGAKDGDRPEEWIASVTEARNRDFLKDEGLSKATIEGQTYKLTDLIKADAEILLGKDHVNKYGLNTALLTKVLDAAVRLSIQVHPTKQYAKAVFDSGFGKTEAWYILGGREVDGEPPYVLVGFRPEVTKEKWKKYFKEQDIESMIGSLHKFYVKPGDVFLIIGGVPHAIGAGCFLIEIQEPTDYTMRVERTGVDGTALPDFLCHQGVGFDKMLDCFEYDMLSREDTYNKYFKPPRVLSDGENVITGLITEEDTDCFSMKKLSVKTTVFIADNSFKSCIVLSGEGELVANDKTVLVKQGDTLFLPAAANHIEIKNTGLARLEMVLCYPPK